MPTSSISILFPKPALLRFLPSRLLNPNRHLLTPSSPIFQRLTTPLRSLSPVSAGAPSTAAAAADDAIIEASLPPSLRDIVSLFRSSPDAKSKYQQLLEYGRRLPPLDAAHHTDANRVAGCVSRVWVRAFLDDSGAVRFEADSDSALTKGLAALLVLGLSGSPPHVVASVPVDFIRLLGLQQSLTPSRNSGLLNMFKLMQRKATELDAAGLGGKNLDFGNTSKQIEKFSSAGVIATDEGNSDSDETLGVASANGYSAPVEGENSNFDMDAMEGNEVATSGVVGGRKERIIERLGKELQPVELIVEDISHLHKGHVGVAGSAGETHFNVRVVSSAFEGKSLLKRHRLVYDLLKDELNSGLHALSIDAKTPSEV